MPAAEIVQYASAACAVVSALLWWRSARVTWTEAEDQSRRPPGERAILEFNEPKQNRLNAQAAILTGVAAALQAVGTAIQAVATPPGH